MLRFIATGAWWEVLERARMTLLVTREYEHLVVGLTVSNEIPSISFARMPHPSGLVVDRRRGIVQIASTRNPNQIFDLAPVEGLLNRSDVKLGPIAGRPLVPFRSRYFPGCLYLHDLALIEGELHANAVGQNAIIRIDDRGKYDQAWWPRCVEVNGQPVLGQNHIQLNSIAGGPDLNSSFFSASSDRISARRPGHQNYAVDGRGVIFSGETREPIVRGLTRPHSARIWDNRLWIDNSGYGDLVVAEGGSVVVVTHLPGWTRGLCIDRGVAFVGTSRVIPRYSQYAPGLDVESSVCGVHAIDLKTGSCLGSLEWPNGNQIFAIDWVANDVATGFPFEMGKLKSQRPKQLFYAFATHRPG